MKWYALSKLFRTDTVATLKPVEISCGFCSFNLKLLLCREGDKCHRLAFQDMSPTRWSL